MKFIATYRTTRYSNDRRYSIIANDIFEADKKAEKIANEEGWIYTGITPANAEL